MTSVKNRTSSSQKTRARDAFASILAQIRAVEESNYKDITVDVRAAVTTATRAWPQIRLLRPQFVRELPAFPISQFDKLDTYALALGHAHTAFQEAIVLPASLVELAYRALRTRDIMLAEFNSIEGAGRARRAMCGDPKNAKDCKNIRDELSLYLLLLRYGQPEGSVRTGVGIEDLDRADALAEQLQAATIESQDCPEVPKQVDCDLRAAFTLFINAYQRVCAAIAYLRFDVGDAAVIAPPLRVLRFARESKPTADIAATPSGPSVSDGPVQSTSTSIAVHLPLTGWSDPSKRSPFKA